MQFTVNSSSLICQCSSVCTLRFYCEECGKCFKGKEYHGKHKVSVHQGQHNSNVKNVINDSKQITISEDIKSMFIRVLLGIMW